jgi:trimeric autotransporter adhesin
VFVKWLNPLPGEVDVPRATTIDFILGNGSATTVSAASIQLRLNGSSLTPVITQPPGTNVTLVSYDPPGDLAAEETHTVRLVFSDNSNPAYSLTNEYTFMAEPTTISLVAITETNLWRYEQSGTDLGTAWKEKNYDDSTWPEGAALLGVESGTTPEPLRTSMTLGSHVTYYFRIPFVYSGPAGIRLRLRHVVDDGAVFYLNGAEVHRFGIAPGASFTFTTPFADHENEYEGPFLIPTASLVQGTNILAVEVHQTSTTSSDLVFGAVLDAITSHLARYTVESVTPAPNAVDVPRTTPISLNIVDGTNVVQANSVQMRINGQSVSPLVNKPGGSSVTSISYNPGSSLAYGSPVSVEVQFTDNGPLPNTTTYQWSYSTSLETLTLVAVDEVTLWRYEVNGLDLGTAWTATNYNDSAWPLGAALLADETGATVEPIRTPFARNGYISFYFRTPFNFARSTTGVILRLRHVVDDGAVFYLNGVEVNRTANMPPGAINYLTVATADQENAWRGPFTIPTTSLVTGTNVLAVSVHQNSSGSSDVVFGAELTAVIVLPASFVNVGPVPGGLRLQWTSTGTLEQANAVTGPWSTAPNQSNPQIVPTTNPAKFYRIKQ